MECQLCGNKFKDTSCNKCGWSKVYEQDKSHLFEWDASLGEYIERHKELQTGDKIIDFQNA